MKQISVVVPVYNSEETIHDLVDQVVPVVAQYGQYEIILVNDGSSDRSAEVMRTVAEKNNNVITISFFRNFGQISAIMAGLRHSHGKIVVIMDDDLQNPPQEIKKLVAALGENNDFVFGISQETTQAHHRRFYSWIAKRLSDLLIKKPKDLYHSSFLAMSGELAAEVCRYDGPYPFLAGLIFRISNKGASVLVNSAPRRLGVSGYNFRKLLSLWLNSMTNFSIVPLRISSVLGVFTATIGFVVLAYLIVRKVMYGDFLSGWPSLFGATLLFSGIQLVAIGTIGEYMGRSFMVLNKTPQYVIKEKMNYEDRAE